MRKKEGKIPTHGETQRREAKLAGGEIEKKPMRAAGRRAVTSPAALLPRPAATRRHCVAFSIRSPSANYWNDSSLGRNADDSISTECRVGPWFGNVVVVVVVVENHRTSSLRR